MTALKLKPSAGQKIFPEKIPCNRHKKISTKVFWRIRPKLASQKSLKTPIKKNVFCVRRLFWQLPSDAKAANKICKFVWSLGDSFWVWARTHDVRGLPQSALPLSTLALAGWLSVRRGRPAAGHHLQLACELARPQHAGCLFGFR